MKHRIQTVCLAKKDFEELPRSVRMIIEADSLNFADQGHLVTFEIKVATLYNDTNKPGPLYINRYFCDRDHVEWCLTGCRGPEPDYCPDCGRPNMPLMSEQEGCITEHPENILRAAFQKISAESRN